MIQDGLAAGMDGWLDDDLAFVKPWGFDVGAITVPTSGLAGRAGRLMVPGAHGRWLRDARGRRGGRRPAPSEGHLTLFVNRVGEIQELALEGLSLTQGP